MRIRLRRELCPTARNAPLSGLPFRHDFVELLLAHASTHDNDDLGRLGPESPRDSKCLSNQALGAVALNGIADAARRRNADARTIRRGRALHEEDKARRYDAPPRLLDPSKIRPLSDAVTSREPTNWPGIDHDATSWWPR